MGSIWKINGHLKGFLTTVVGNPGSESFLRMMADQRVNSSLHHGFPGTRVIRLPRRPLKIMCCNCKGPPVTHCKPHRICLFILLSHHFLLTLGSSCCQSGFSNDYSAWKPKPPPPVSHNSSWRGY